MVFISPKHSRSDSASSGLERERGYGKRKDADLAAARQRGARIWAEASNPQRWLVNWNERRNRLLWFSVFNETRWVESGKWSKSRRRRTTNYKLSIFPTYFKLFPESTIYSLKNILDICLYSNKLWTSLFIYCPTHSSPFLPSLSVDFIKQIFWSSTYIVTTCEPVHCLGLCGF